MQNASLEGGAALVGEGFGVVNIEAADQIDHGDELVEGDGEVVVRLQPVGVEHELGDFARGFGRFGAPIAVGAVALVLVDIAKNVRFAIEDYFEITREGHRGNFGVVEVYADKADGVCAVGGHANRGINAEHHQVDRAGAPAGSGGCGGGNGGGPGLNGLLIGHEDGRLGQGLLVLDEGKRLAERGAVDTGHSDDAYNEDGEDEGGDDELEDGFHKGRSFEGEGDRLTSSVVFEHDKDGFGEDVDIQPDRPVHDVVVVEGGALGKGGLVAPGDLPQAGHAGQHALVVFEGGAVDFGLVEHDRARTHQAHFAGEHVPQLGQLVNGEAAQQPADGGDAGVAAQFLVAIPFFAHVRVVFEEGLEHLVGVDVHGAEFQHLDHAPVFAEAGLAVEDRPGRGDLDQQGDQGQQGRDEQQPQAGAEHVNEALFGLGGAVEQVVVNLEAEQPAVFADGQAAQIEAVVAVADEDDALEGVLIALAQLGQLFKGLVEHEGGVDVGQLRHEVHVAQGVDGQVIVGGGGAVERGEDERRAQADLGAGAVALGGAQGLVEGPDDGGRFAPPADAREQGAGGDAPGGDEDEAGQPGEDEDEPRKLAGGAGNEGKRGEDEADQGGGDGEAAELGDEAEASGGVEAARGVDEQVDGHSGRQPLLQAGVERAEREAADEQGQQGGDGEHEPVGEDEAEAHDGARVAGVEAGAVVGAGVSENKLVFGAGLLHGVFPLRRASGNANSDSR